MAHLKLHQQVYKEYMFVYSKNQQALLTWFTSMLENNITIYGSLLLEELVNLLTHLIATLSRYYVLTFENPQ